MLTKPYGGRTWASLFPNVNNPLENREIRKDWRLGIHFRPITIPKEKGYFTVKMEIPGLKMEDFNVEIKSGELTITAETNEFLSKDNDKFLQEEVIRHFYKKVFKLPENVNSEEVNATFKDDVLILNLPLTS